MSTLNFNCTCSVMFVGGTSLYEITTTFWLKVAFTAFNSCFQIFPSLHTSLASCRNLIQCSFFVSCLTWRCVQFSATHVRCSFSSSDELSTLAATDASIFHWDSRAFLNEALFESGWYGGSFPFTALCCMALELASEFRNSFLFLCV